MAEYSYGPLRDACASYSSLRSLNRYRASNRLDWGQISSGAYRSELVTLYHHTGLAKRGVSFESAVTTGTLAGDAKEIGLFEQIKVRVIVTNKGSLNNEPGYRSWETKRVMKKIMVTVDPCDHEHFFTRFIHKILGHYDRDVSHHPRLAVVLYEKGGQKRLSSDSQVFLGQIMGMRNKEVYACVEQSDVVITRTSPPVYVRKTLSRLHSRTDVKVVEQVTVSKAGARRARRRERLVQAPLQGSQGASVFKAPSQPLTGLAKDLSEKIGQELYKEASNMYQKELDKAGGTHKAARNAVDALIADPLFVNSAVTRAVTDDSIYAKADPSAPNANAYWSKRSMNIAEMINTISSSVSRTVGETKAGVLFKACDKTKQGSLDTGGSSLPIAADQNTRKGKPFTGDIAKKAFSDASIGCGIWDSLRDWCGFGSHHDDGCYPYRNAPFLGHGHSILPHVHCVPDRCHGHHHHHDDKNVVKQKVIVRIHSAARRKAKKGHSHTHVVEGSGAKHVVAASTAGEDSDSSGDDDVLLDMARRKEAGLPYRHINEDGEDDDDGGGDKDEFCPDTTLPHHHQKAPKSEVTVKSVTNINTGDGHGHGHTDHLDAVKYSNFIKVVKESGCLEETTTPHVLLALDNTVLTDANCHRIRSSKEGCRGFIKRYLVPCHADARDLCHPCFRHPTLLGGVLLISAAGVHFAAHTALVGAKLILAAGATLTHATLRTIHFVVHPHFPHHIHILPFPALHHHFPKHGHGLLSHSNHPGHFTDI